MRRYFILQTTHVIPQTNTHILLGMHGCLEIAPRLIFEYIYSVTLVAERIIEESPVKMLNHKLSVIALHILLPGCVTAGFAADTSFSECPQYFPKNTPPAFNQQELLPRALCFSGFAALHSGKTHTPLRCRATDQAGIC